MTVPGMDPKQIAIMIQATAHDTATLLADDLDLDETLERFPAVHERIFNHVVTMYAAELVKAGFDGAQEVAAPAPQAPAQTPIPGATSDQGTDAKWASYFANPQDYYDNRRDKKSAGSPDFKHKRTGEALWLDGKYGSAPQWVLNKLGVQA